MVQVQTLIVQEGGSALLVCSCKADPPVSEYRWSYSQYGRTVHLHQRTHAIRLFNVTKDMRVRCSAQNMIGRGESRATPLNIQCNPTPCRPTSNGRSHIQYILYLYMWTLLQQALSACICFFKAVKE